MKLNGIWFDVEGLDEYTCVISDAVVTKEKLALDWTEDGSFFHALLTSTDGGTWYFGTYGSPGPEAGCHMEAQRFDAKSGEVLLRVKWFRKDTGYEGFGVIHLASHWDD